MKYLKLIIGVAVLGGILGVGAKFLLRDPHVVQGRKLFEYYCAACHGEKGYGNGFNATNLDPRPRDLSDRLEPYMAGLSNEEIFNAIRNGVAGVFPAAAAAGHGELSAAAKPAAKAPAAAAGPKAEEEEEGGSPLMPYWGFTLSDDQVWSLVAFVRTLHKNKAEKIEFKDAAPAAEKPVLVSRPQPASFPAPSSPDAQRMIEEGKRLYETRYSCAGCHRINGNGGKIGPDLSRSGFRLNLAWIYQWIQAPQSFKSDTRMPAFNMPEEEAKAISLYLKTLNPTTAEAPGPPFGLEPSKG